MSAPRHGANGGLTLIEVLLALAILGVGLTVLVATTARCLSVARKARHFETARHLLGVVEIEHPFDPEGDAAGASDGGRFDPPGERYTWSRSFAPAGEEDGDGLYEVSTRIGWTDRGREIGEQVVTLRYAPDEAATGGFTRAAAPTVPGARGAP